MQVRGLSLELGAPTLMTSPHAGLWKGPIVQVLSAVFPPLGSEAFRLLSFKKRCQGVPLHGGRGAGVRNVARLHLKHSARNPPKNVAARLKCEC